VYPHLVASSWLLKEKQWWDRNSLIVMPVVAKNRNVNIMFHLMPTSLKISMLVSIIVHYHTTQTLRY